MLGEAEALCAAEGAGAGRAGERQAYGSQPVQCLEGHPKELEFHCARWNAIGGDDKIQWCFNQLTVAAGGRRHQLGKGNS